MFVQEQKFSGFGEVTSTKRLTNMQVLMSPASKLSAEDKKRKSAMIILSLNQPKKESGFKKVISKSIDPLGLMKKAPVRRAIGRAIDPLGLTKRGGVIGKVVDPLGIVKKVSGERKPMMAMARYPMMKSNEKKSEKIMNTISEVKPVTSAEQISTALVSSNMMQPSADKWNFSPAFDSTLVTVYASDGTKGQIERGYLVNGEYSEDGIKWTTTLPIMKSIASSISESMATESNEDYETPESGVELATVYAPDGTEGMLPKQYLINGQYEEDGIVWTSTPTFSLKSLWNKIAEALNTSNDMQGFGEEYTSFITGPVGSSGGGNESNFLTTIKETADSVKSVTDTAKAYGSAYRGIKRKFSDQPSSAPIVPPSANAKPKVNKIFGLPPAVALGGMAVGVTGLGILIVKKMGNKQE